MSTLALDRRRFSEWNESDNQTPGFSDFAELAKKRIKVVRGHYEKPVTNKRHTARAFSAVVNCLIDDWDGYGARSISHKIALRAAEFASRLNPTLPEPEFSPEPDGELAIEWHGENSAIYSISIGESDQLNYAATFPDGNQTHGTENYKSNAQAHIEANIRRVLGA